MSPTPKPGLTARGQPRTKRVRTLTGCLVCRARRVKCDEGRPRCKNCLRHPARVCEYAFDANSTQQRASPPSTPVAGPSMSFSSDASEPAYTPAPPGSHSSHASHTSHTGQYPTHTSPPSLPAPPIAAPPAAPHVQYVAQPEPLRPPDMAFPFVSPQPKPLHRPALSDAPSLPFDLQERFATRVQSAMIADEGRVFSILGPANSPMLADTLISKLPGAALRTLFASHEQVVRGSFSRMQDDRECRLLCGATALLAARSTGAGRTGKALAERGNTLAADYMAIVTREQPSSEIRGILGATGFTLYLEQTLSPVPGRWREQLAVGTEWAARHGGAGWVLGVRTPQPGFGGNEFTLLHPLAFALYSDFTALLSVLAAMTDGTCPTYVTSDPQWLLAARALQVRLLPGLPDLFHQLLCTPRVVLPTLANAVALVSRIRSPSQPDIVREQLEHDAATLRIELEHTWPARFASRNDPKPVAYGAMAWRLALLAYVVQCGQRFAPSSPDLQGFVAAFLDLAADAAVEMPHLDGWLWPVILIALAAHTHEHRVGCAAVLDLVRSPIEADNREIVGRVSRRGSSGRSPATARARDDVAHNTCAGMVMWPRRRLEVSNRTRLWGWP